MMKWMLPVATLACAGLMAGGCSSRQNDGGSMTPDAGPRAAAAANAAEPVEILELVRGDNAALERGGVTLVKDEAGLGKLGLDALEGLSPNWAEQDVVILALGEQTSGGFWADITGIQLVDDTLFVQSKVNRPGDDAAATQALTYPYAAALISETTATRAQGDYEEVVGQPMPE